MTADNKRNIYYFEGDSMQKLYASIDAWQGLHQKRLQSISVQYDNGKFCCIALSNPTEVYIMNGGPHDGARVTNGNLWVRS